MVVTGHDTIHSWECVGGKARIKQSKTSILAVSPPTSGGAFNKCRRVLNPHEIGRPMRRALRREQQLKASTAVRLWRGDRGRRRPFHANAARHQYGLACVVAGEAGAEPGIAAVGLMSMPMPGTTFVRCDHAGQSQNCGAEREFVRGRTARVQEKAHQFQHLVVSRLEHSNSCANMVNDPSTQGAVTLLWNP